MTLTRALLTLLTLGTLSACGTVRTWVKASPARPSAFVERPELMRRMAPDAAFQFEWRQPDPQVVRRAQGRRELYIAPVTLAYLRPMTVGVTKLKQTQSAERDAGAPKIARYAHDEFMRAFQQAVAPRYRVVNRPAPGTLTLELAVVELNPTKVGTNAGKLAAKLLLGPVGSVGGLVVKGSGNVAIEGKLRLSETGQTVFQFADNESDKLTFYSLRDFAPYGHAMVAVDEWAQQFEALTRSSPGQTVEDATFWTLMPW